MAAPHALGGCRFKRALPTSPAPLLLLQNFPFPAHLQRLAAYPLAVTHDPRKCTVEVRLRSVNKGTTVDRVLSSETPNVRAATGDAPRLPET